MANCYVRVWIPHDPDENWGYYDLYIEGSVTVKGTTLKNAVFAYGSDSKLYIYPENRTTKNYPVSKWVGYTAYRWKFSSSKISNFETKINKVISSIDSSSNANLVKCNIESDNVFATYSRKEINSFAAVAAWCNWLGKSNLLDEYNDAHDSAYKKYLPKALYNDNSISNNWVSTTMNGN